MKDARRGCPAGRLLFSVKYPRWLCRYGYRNNPYEVEARAAENQPNPAK